MRRFLLNDDWTMFYFDRPCNGERPSALREEKRLPVTLPTNAELAFQKAGFLPENLYKGENFKKLKQYEYYSYMYTKTIEIPSISGEESIEIVFHGADCFCEYFIDDISIGKSNNMFIPHRFDITEQVKGKTRVELSVIINAAIYEAAKADYTPLCTGLDTNADQLYVRKPQYAYGHDIMVRAVTSGLWRDVEMLVHQKNEIEDIYFANHAADAERAYLYVHFKIRCDVRKIGRLSLKMEGSCGESHFEMTHQLTFVYGFFRLYISNPKLWWPKGYGDPNLYEVKATLIEDGAEIDAKCYRIGLRSIKLHHTDMVTDENPAFEFIVNGEKVFIKGTNHVPVDPFPSNEKKFEPQTLALIADIGCNLIRCWGGNYYPAHELYDFCDENGILVWQEFAMACAAYPHDEAFLANVKEEAIAIIKMLRNHASLAIWVGDNECDMDYVRRGINPDLNIITRELLPRLALQHDPYRPYLASSPLITKAMAQTGASMFCTELGTEDHLWGPRDYFKSDYYTKSKAHFIGEIGYHGCPARSSIEKFIDEQSIWPWQDNLQWVYHCTSMLGFDSWMKYRVPLMANQTAQLFGQVPEHLEDFIFASQASQAQANKFFIEMARIRKSKMGGLIWWNIRDGWPQFSDAVVDYYFHRKMAYDYIKKSQEDVLVAIGEYQDWNLPIYLLNDTLEAVSGEYKVYDADTNEVFAEGSYGAKANETMKIGSFKLSISHQRLLIIAFTRNSEKSFNHYMHGFPPFSIEKYKQWHALIRTLKA